MTLKQLDYPQLQETVWHETLDNGLAVYLLPKPGFTKTFATFTTKYGSIDYRFKPPGREMMQVPDGIAHFLEHKMFEEPQGDVFSRFAAQGASVNAFTSFDRTAYLFSATRQIEDNLQTLLDFVQNPHFTDENVEKEKGIIIQEIDMYRDNPDWRVYFGLIEALYQEHPVRIDIAGTAESVRKITKEMLYDCYNTFYHPANMTLFVVGGIDPEPIMTLIKRNQAGKSFAAAEGKIERLLPEEPPAVTAARREIPLPVSLPKCMFGFKEQPAPSGEQAVVRELTSRLMLEAVLGKSSPLYQSLYDDGLIADNFGHEYNSGPGYAFSAIGGETPDPDALQQRVCEALYAAAEQGLDSAVFERTRRKRIGAYLRMLNSPEAIAGEFTRYKHMGGDLFRVVELYERMTLDDINARLREHVSPDRLAACIVRSPNA